MGENNNFENHFIGKSALSKTLRNELIPIGHTKEMIEKYGIISQDEARTEQYKKAKEIIDDYHRYYIEKSLMNFKSDWNEFFDVMEAVRKSDDDSLKKKFAEIQSLKRKEITKYLRADENYKNMFNAKLITEVLPKFIVENNTYTPEEKTSKLETIKTFDKFATYFEGFHKNRENIYTDEEISTSIAYRVVNDNAKIFYDNLCAYNRIVEKCGSEIENIEKTNQNLLDGWTISQIFNANYYDFLMIQKSIEHYNDICAVINSYMNEYCQQHKDNKKQYKMKRLHKQILSITSTIFEIPEKFENDEQVYFIFNSFIDEITNQKILERITTLFENFNIYDLKKIYISGKSYASVSKQIVGDWSLIDKCLTEYYSKKINGKDDKEKIRKAINSEKYRSIEQLNTLIDEYHNKKEGIEQEIKTTQYVLAILENIANTEWKKLSYDSDIKLIESDDEIAKIKDIVDSIQDTLHLLKPFQINEEIEKNIEFYSEYDEICEILGGIIPIYNKIRNYVTQKPYEQEKIKLNFANPTLANGWDKNKEYDYNAMLFMRNELYYLGIYNAKNKPAKNALDGSDIANDSSDYSKMVYKLLPGPNKMLPKVFLSKKGIETYSPSDYILEGYAAGKHKKGKNFDLKFCHDLIDYFKVSIDRHPDYKEFGFVFTDTNKYSDISEFYQEITEQGYKISFEYLSEALINDLIENEQLYFFQIYNKDFAKGKKGKDNLHTMYFKNIFSQENLKDIVIKLNGQAELFYRKSSIRKPYMHKKGEILLNKKLSDKTTPIPDDLYKEIFDYLNNDCQGKLSENAQKIFDETRHFNATMDIVKDKRYSVDKIFSHVPITINFKARSGENVNDTSLKYIAQNHNDMHIIGIDRGERNLIYVSVIDSKGNIVKQKSFNVVGNYDYQKKLAQRENERDIARKSWKSIGKIAELKEGYLSQVIHEITELMIEYNAIIVMEDLNFGFKRGRFKVERQVYQKFEKMLIDKLEYLASKSKAVEEPGGLLRGYQLAYKVDNLEKLGKQCGMIFYVPAAYTSKIDPVTGFVDVFKFKDLTSGKLKREFLLKFDEIKYDTDKDMFAYSFDYNNFDTFQTMSVTKWKAYTYGKRVVKHKDTSTGRFSDEIVDVTSKLKEILDSNNITYTDGHNLLSDIQLMDERRDLMVLSNLCYYFKLTVQMRNSLTNDVDYDKIISPIMNKSGTFFETNEDVEGVLPADADANGAFHIALKGLYELQQISANWKEGEKFPKDKLKLSNQTWFDYVQNRRFKD